MNKKLPLLALVVLLCNVSAFSKKVTVVSQSSFTFSPDSVSIVVGDTIIFSGSSFHPIAEVSQSTWIAFGSTSNGGFAFPGGSGQFSPVSAGVYYYVCTNHVGSGMRGRIFVGVASGIALNENPGVPAISVYPNPANNFINVSYRIPSTGAVSVSVFNILGKEVLPLFKGSQQAGNYQRQFALDSILEPGVYFVKVRTVSREFISKLIVQ